MDWTGGVRRRYAQKSKSSMLLQKQKDHFAKARARALTISTNFLPAGVSGHHQPSREDTNHAQSHGVWHDPSHSRTHPVHDGHVFSNQDQAHRNSFAHETSTAVALPHPSRDIASACRPESAEMDDEARLLMANRQRLLARKDWLGLAASRPAPYCFPSSRDRDRVGKRRKVHKPESQRHQPVHQRPATPLFELRPPLPEYVMSGALPDEDIQIKIGTDAFATQTQASRQTPRLAANTSMRQPSTELTVLSEESMLLGVDEDGFETLDQSHSLLSLPVSNSLQPSRRDTDQLAFLADSQVPSLGAPTSGGIPIKAEMCLFLESDRDEPHLLPEKYPEAVVTCDAEDSNDNLSDLERAPIAPAQSASLASDVTDEKAWRTLLEIEEATSCQSVAALRSSSMHATQSTTTAWQPIVPVMAAVKTAIQTKPTFQASQAGKPSKYPHDEDLWRDFVISSQSSDYLSTRPIIQHAMHAPESDFVVPAQSISSRSLTEQLRSDRVTLGGSVFAGAAEMDDDRDVQHGCREDSDHTSLIGNAATTNHDEIEDNDSYGPHSYTTWNIHASSAMPMTNYQRRFRKSGKQKLR